MIYPWDWKPMAPCTLAILFQLQTSRDHRLSTPYKMDSLKQSRRIKNNLIPWLACRTIQVQLIPSSRYRLKMPICLRTWQKQCKIRSRTTSKLEIKVVQRSNLSSWMSTDGCSPMKSRPNKLVLSTTLRANKEASVLTWEAKMITLHRESCLTTWLEMRLPWRNWARTRSLHPR